MLGTKKVCGVDVRPRLRVGHAHYARGSSRPGLRLRLWRTAPLLGRGRCLALSGAPPPVASGRACPPLAALRPSAAAPGRRGSRFGWLPVWLRPCLSAPGPVSGGPGLLGCGLAAPASPPPGSAVPPGRAFPLAPPPGGRAAARARHAAPFTAPPPRLAPGAGVIRCGGVVWPWCVWYNRTEVR